MLTVSDIKLFKILTDYYCEALNISNANKTVIEYVEYKKTKVESVVEFSCLDGFSMVPSHDTVTYTCQPEGSWNFVKVQCLKRELLKLYMAYIYFLPL